MKNLFKVAETREEHNNQMHNIGRIFTWATLALILLVPILFCLEAKVTPDWSLFLKTLPAIVGAYFIVGFVEAISYAPLLGTGGQYLSFITGNISNLKLPCAINAQNITKCQQGTEEQEIITTISIAVSSIVTTVIILIGLIPLALLQESIVEAVKPVSPYVIPAIFGGLLVALMAKYAKMTAIPFVICILISVITNILGSGLNQSVMVIVGMVVSGIYTFVMYKLKKI